MSNDHLLSLMNQVTPADTLVILSRGLRYSSAAERLRVQQQYQDVFTHFQNTLLSGDESQIAKLYDPIKSLRARHSSDSIEQYIAAINARDITIVLNPELPTNYKKEAGRFLVMKGDFGTENERQFTLYWRELSNGEWRIATEVWSNPKT